MGGNAGSANIHISADGEDQAARALKNVHSALTAIGQVAISAAAIGITAFGAALGVAVNEAMSAQKVIAQTAAVIESTGGAAGMSAKAIGDLATSLSQVTPFADDVIQSGENLLLTFTNIGAEVFPAATKAMLDMSTAMGQDLKASAIQLGKALNNPLEGITALQRIGVTFSKTQVDLIKNFMEMGDVVSAQNVILAELNKEFGGSAEAAGKTFAGQLEILKNQLLNVAEAAGMALLPALGELVTKVGPSLIDMATRGATALTEFVTSFKSSPIAKFGQVLYGTFLNIKAGMSVGEALGRVFGNILPPEIMSAFKDFGNEVSGAFAKVMASNGPEIMANLASALDSLGKLIVAYGPGIIEFFGVELAAGIQVLGGLAEAITGVVAALGLLLTGDSAGALATLQAGLTGFADSVVQAFGGESWAAVGEQWAGIWDNIKTIASQGGENISAAINGFLSNAAASVTSAAAGIIAAGVVWGQGLIAGVMGVVSTLVGAVTGAIDNTMAAAMGLVGAMGGVGAALAKGLVSGAAGIIGQIVGVVVDAVMAAVAAAKAAAGISSPSKVTAKIGGQLMEGLTMGINRNMLDPINAMGMAMNKTLGGNATAPAPLRNISTTNNNQRAGDVYHVNITAQNGATLNDLMKQAQAAHA